jgi:myo-inositol-1(or 4)-monophosphatase
MNISAIAEVVDWVQHAGSLAREAQRDRSKIKRDYKSDGSVSTTIDLQVEDFLVEKIAARFPTANIITEETVRSYDPKKPHTFVIDPIDGTDTYSQGLPGWCVSVGLLDHNLQPIAGIVYSPRMELLFFADVGKQAICNGIAIAPPADMAITRKSNLMVSSRILRDVDLSRYPGKIRSIGSGALHMCLPLVSPAIIGSLGQRGAYIWDITGAHAINRSIGYDLQYLNGKGMDYSQIIDGSPAGDVTISGAPEFMTMMREIIAG